MVEQSVYAPSGNARIKTDECEKLTATSTDAGLKDTSTNVPPVNVSAGLKEVFDIFQT